jgi:hypothetical protein
MAVEIGKKYHETLDWCIRQFIGGNVLEGIVGPFRCYSCNERIKETPILIIQKSENSTSSYRFHRGCLKELSESLYGDKIN